MSGLSHTPGKRARGKTLRGFESPLLRQKNNPVSVMTRGFVFGRRVIYLFVWIIFIAEATRADTSVMLLGIISVVVASVATLP